MKMVGKKILVEQFRTKDMTDGGIALPEQTIQKLPWGTVVKTGPEVEGFYEGDVLAFNAIGAISVEVRGKEFVLIEPEDILMILEEGEYDEPR